MNTTIINMLTRAATGVVSTLVGIKVGKTVADSHNTATAVAAASAATLTTYIVANEVCNNILAKSSAEPVFDVEPTFDEDYVGDNADTTQDDEADDDEDGNEFPSLLSSEFSPSSDEGSSNDDEPTSDSSTASDEEITSDEFNTSTDEAAGNASDNVGDNADTTDEMEDEIKVEARKFLEETGGDVSVVKGGINAALLKACLDSLLKNPELYKTTTSEDDDRVFISGPGVEIINDVANVALVRPSGKCDWDQQEQLMILSDKKYFVTPGETDSFGWLTGCINTPAGIIVYG